MADQDDAGHPALSGLREIAATVAVAGLGVANAAGSIPAELYPADPVANSAFTAAAATTDALHAHEDAESRRDQISEDIQGPDEPDQAEHRDPDDGVLDRLGIADPDPVVDDSTTEAWQDDDANAYSEAADPADASPDGEGIGL